MDCLQQFFIFPNPTAQKISYFHELQQPQTTHIQLQEDLSKGFYLFETPPLEILQLDNFEQSSNNNSCRIMLFTVSNHF